jgi:hypothetical protein
VGLLVKMGEDLREIYGLTDEQIDFDVQNDWKHRAWGAAYKRQTLSKIRQFLTRDAIVAVLGRLLPGLEAKELARWVPFVGQAVAAIVGYKLTTNYAQLVMETCEERALAWIRHA